MLVSVIIPNYNHAAYLKQRIESVLNQTFQDFEMILLDDCSSDTSRDVMHEYRDHPKVSFIVFNEKNSCSPFKQWAKGFELAKGDFIWIAESDDYADPEFLSKCVMKLELAKCDFVHTDSRIVDSKGEGSAVYSQLRNDFFKTRLWSIDHVTLPRQTILDYLIYRCIVNNASSMVFRKGLLTELNIQKLGSYKSAGDLYFLFHVLKKSPCCFIAQPLNYYRFHGESTTVQNSKIGLVRKEAFTIVKNELVSFVPLDNIERSKLKSAAKYVLMFYGRETLKEMSFGQFMNCLSEFVKAKLLSYKEVLCLYMHIQLEKRSIRGQGFISKYLLKTNSWKRYDTIRM